MALGNVLDQQPAGGLISQVTGNGAAATGAAAPAAPTTTTPPAAPASTAVQPSVESTPPPAETAPAGITKQTGPTSGSFTPVAYTGEVDPSKTTQGLITQITSQDSELMKLASQRGFNMASRRGLGNSSVAAQASQAAVLDAAMPIAQSDAALHQQQSLTNQGAMNTAAGAFNEAGLTQIRAEMQNYAVDNEFRNRLLQQYMEGGNAVLNNKDMTTEQKQASIQKMYENLKGTMALQAATNGIDVSKYKPGGGSTTTPGGTGTGGALPSDSGLEGIVVNGRNVPADWNPATVAPDRAAALQLEIKQISKPNMGSLSSMTGFLEKQRKWIDKLTPAERELVYSTNKPLVDSIMKGMKKGPAFDWYSTIPKAS